MKTFSDITIQNFRGLDHVEVCKLGKLNIFHGKNNCGKTSLLEAFFLLSGISNPGLISNVNFFRNHSLTPIVYLKYLNYNALQENTPVLKCSLSNGDIRELKFSKLSDTSEYHALKTDDKNTLASDEQCTFQQSLSFDYSICSGNDNKEAYSSKLLFEKDGTVRALVDARYNEILKSVFISDNYSMRNLLEGLSDIIRQNRKKELLTKLQAFDPQITNIELLTDSIYIGYDNIMAQMLPLGMCGEGLRRFLSILVPLINAQGDILLIDEIENGLHYSVYPLLWKSILELALKNYAQVMVATHSRELVNSLYESIKNSDFNTSVSNDDICVYTLARTLKAGLKTYRYNLAGIENFLLNDIEVRN